MCVFEFWICCLLQVLMLACVCPWYFMWRNLNISQSVPYSTTFSEIILQRLGLLGVSQACLSLPHVLVRCLVRDGRRSWHSLEPTSSSSTSQCHICTVNDIQGHRWDITRDIGCCVAYMAWSYMLHDHCIYIYILCISVSWWSWLLYGSVAHAAAIDPVLHRQNMFASVLPVFERTIVNVEVGDEPGNYGKGNLGLGFLGPVKDPEARKKKLSAELANGRLAMMAIIGMLLSWYFEDVWITLIDSKIVLWCFTNLCLRWLWAAELMWMMIYDPNIQSSEMFCDAKVLPGRPHWLCLGWLGLVHWLSAAQRSEKPWLQHPARVGEAKDRLQPEICFGVVVLIVHCFFLATFMSIHFRTLQITSEDAGEIWWVYCSMLELCWCQFSARSKVILRLWRPCGWPGTSRFLGPPWSFQGQGCGGLQEAGLMLVLCLAGRSRMICLICFQTL